MANNCNQGKAHMAAVLKNNKVIGKSWEEQVASKSLVAVEREVVMQPLDSTRQPMLTGSGKPLTIRIDILKLKKSGPGLLECKNGPSAPLTKNQALAIPLIEMNGFMVLSNRLQVRKGTLYGPTKVQVVRPAHGGVWKPRETGSGTTLHLSSGADVSSGGRFMGAVGMILRVAIVSVSASCA